MTIEKFAGLEIEVIYEDEILVVINKPAGIVANKTQTISEATIQDWMAAKLGEEQGIEKILADKKNWQELTPADFDDTYGIPEEIFKQRQGLAHRLDRHTSGVLLLAKNPGALVSLLHQFKQRQTQKKYVCLVHGQMKVASAAIRAPIGRSTVQRHKFRVEIDGKPAVTYYRLLQFYSGIDVSKLNQKDLTPELLEKLASYQHGFSLLECMPKTGRTHQIRVHLAHIDHPLVGDNFYGGGRRCRLDLNWCPRHFLHALQIQFIHPQTKQSVNIKAPLPADLQQVLTLLKS